MITHTDRMGIYCSKIISVQCRDYRPTKISVVAATDKILQIVLFSCNKIPMKIQFAHQRPGKYQ